MFSTVIGAALVVRVCMPNVSPEEAKALMARVAEGDERAFATVVETYQQDVARYCARFVGDVELAADLTQEVFLTLWKERARYRSSGALRHYLLRIARHRCLALAKKRRLRAQLLQRWQLPQQKPSGEPSDARSIDRALGKLSPAHRDLIILRYLEELELSEISTVTKLRLGTVKSRLSRAVSALRKELAG